MFNHFSSHSRILEFVEGGLEDEKLSGLIVLVTIIDCES